MKERHLDDPNASLCASCMLLLIDARIWDGGLNNAVEKTQIKFVFLHIYS